MAAANTERKVALITGVTGQVNMIQYINYIYSSYIKQVQKK